MDMSRIQERVISNNVDLITALKQMDSAGVKLLFVMEGGRFERILTIGDIQRAIISGVELNTQIAEIEHSKKEYATVKTSIETIKSDMIRLRAECMPVLDDNASLVDVYFWEDLFENPIIIPREKVEAPVVVMAGGMGTRLKPLTNVIPKPLIPLGEKTIIETIFDQFESIGCKKFYLSVNYKYQILRYYIGSLDHRYDVEYVHEEFPMGTIGSVSLLEEKIDKTFFVTNCDIVIDQDYQQVYEYHKNNKNDITLIASVKDYQIPYGVVETENNGIVTALKEKPNNAVLVNTGVYILEPSVISRIPKNSLFHMTDLIELVRETGGRVGCFPVSEKAWADIGNWYEYSKYVFGKNGNQG